jgi:hypothetical protein
LKCPGASKSVLKKRRTRPLLLSSIFEMLAFEFPHTPGFASLACACQQ